jgi:acylphosphatase
MRESLACRRYFVSGRVQGVGFRMSAYMAARRLGLDGWVRNLPDGRVEALAAGRTERLASFEDWLRAGPPGARVDDLEIRTEDRSPPAHGFSIR